MTHLEFADTIIRLSDEQQNAFFEALKERLSEEDWITTAQFISLWGMYNNPEKFEAMKNAVKSALVEELFGHPYEEPEANRF